MKKESCSIDLCQHVVYARKLCKSHYQKSKRVYKWPDGIRPKLSCSVEGCKRPHGSHGFCTTHLTRWKKHGDPMRSRRATPEGNTPEERFWAQVEIPSDPTKCWIWKGHIQKGYGKTGYRGKRWIAHRLAWFLVKGIEPEGVLRHFECDNPPCINPSHMKEGTSEDNVQDMIAKGRNVMGEGVHTAILTETDIPDIRELLAKGIGTGTIARIYKVCRSTISHIKTGRTWKHI